MKLPVSKLPCYKGNFQIDLSNSALTDVSNLKHLDPNTRRSLLYLNLSRNSLRSIKVLESFCNLWVLNLSHNSELQDYSPLESLRVVG